MAIYLVGVKMHVKYFPGLYSRIMLLLVRVITPISISKLFLQLKTFEDKVYWEINFNTLRYDAFCETVNNFPQFFLACVNKISSLNP